MEFKEFKIEAACGHHRFYVYVKFYFWWVSAYMWTNYFSVGYNTEEEANQAIKMYLQRFTYIK